jgi:hypothetical protein
MWTNPKIDEILQLARRPGWGRLGLRSNKSSLHLKSLLVSLLPHGVSIKRLSPEAKNFMDTKCNHRKLINGEGRHLPLRLDLVLLLGEELLHVQNSALAVVRAQWTIAGGLA